MRSAIRSLALTGVLAIGGMIGWGATPALAQGYGGYPGGGVYGQAYPGMGIGGGYVGSSGIGLGIGVGGYPAPQFGGYVSGYGNAYGGGYRGAYPHHHHRHHRGCGHHGY